MLHFYPLWYRYVEILMGTNEQPLNLQVGRLIRVCMVEQENKNSS